MKSKFQVGEVIRFAETYRACECHMNGRLATISDVDERNPFHTYYFVSYGPTEPWDELDLLPVNGGMPKPENESVSDSADNETDFVTVTRLISGLDSCDYDCLVDWMRDETDRRNNAEHDTLLVDLGVALNRCLDSKLFSFLEQESLNELSKIYENDLDPSVRE